MDLVPSGPPMIAVDRKDGTVENYRSGIAVQGFGRTWA
jgi:hypothetical protein